MKLYLKKELLPLANREASEHLAQIEGLKAQVETLSHEKNFLQSQWHSAYNDAYLISQKLAGGHFEYKDKEDIEKKEAAYKERFERIDGQLNRKKAELESCKAELESLMNSFNEKYVEIEAGELI